MLLFLYVSMWRSFKNLSASDTAAVIRLVFCSSFWSCFSDAPRRHSRLGRRTKGMLTSMKMCRVKWGVQRRCTNHWQTPWLNRSRAVAMTTVKMTGRMMRMLMTRCQPFHCCSSFNNCCGEKTRRLSVCPFVYPYFIPHNTCTFIFSAFHLLSIVNSSSFISINLIIILIIAIVFIFLTVHIMTLQIFSLLSDYISPGDR